MLDRESSLRLDLLRFPLIVGVVFVHAYYGHRTGSEYGEIVGASQAHIIVSIVRNFIAQGVGRITVPLFFLMSGYLFFAGFVWSKESYATKLRSRTKSLLVPFLFWNILTLLVLALGQAIPATSTFFFDRHALIATFGAFDYLNALIGLNRLPIAYQFWFIRDLMILVLLVPLIHFAIRFAPLPFLFLLSFRWIVDGWPLLIPTSEAMLFFCVGAYLASKKMSLFYLDTFGVIIIVLYLAIATIDILIGNLPPNPYLHKIGVAIGVPAALCSTKFIAQHERLRSLIIGLSGASFFVYAIHEPLLKILMRISYRFISPESPYAILALYFLIPTITILVAVIAHRGFSSVAPRLASIVTGGR